MLFSAFSYSNIVVAWINKVDQGSSERFLENNCQSVTIFTITIKCKRQKVISVIVTNLQILQNANWFIRWFQDLLRDRNQQRIFKIKKSNLLSSNI